MKTTKDKTKNDIIHCKDVIIEKVLFTPLDTINERSKGQSISYPHYEYYDNITNKFIIKTDPIIITKYGIPTKNDKKNKMVKNDRDREYFRIPYDETQPNCVSLFELLIKIDNYMETIQKKKIFGLHEDEYIYVPLVKDPVKISEYYKTDIMDENNTKKMKFCKVKFDTDYNDDRRILTSVFVKTNPDKEPKLQKTDTVTKIGEYLRWNSKARFILMFNKLWADKFPKKEGSKIKEFGITMKCLQMEISDIPVRYNMIKNQVMAQYAF